VRTFSAAMPPADVTDVGSGPNNFTSVTATISKKRSVSLASRRRLRSRLRLNARH